MKLNNILRAAGMLLASSIASQALALAPTAVPNYTVYTSGASAQQSTIKAMLTSFCKAGTLNEYQERYVDATGVATTDKQGSNFRAYFCTFKGALDPAPLPTDVALYNKNVLIHNRAKGGSIWGVVPVNESWQVEYLNIFNRPASRACVLTGTTYACPVEKATAPVANRAGTIPFENELECPFTPTTLVANEGNAIGAVGSKDTLCRRSHGGFSDVEAGLFGAPNYPAFPPATDTTLKANLVSKAAYGVVFGVSVDKAVYGDLQTKQGLTGIVQGVDCSLAANKYVMGVCAPSLSKAEVTGIFSGTVQNWTTGMGLVTTQPYGGFMSVCRRVVGSGTQAAANAYWTENPCRPTGSKSFVTAITTADYIVVENSASGDVITCHNQMFAGTHPAAGGFSYGSIGIQAVEKQPTATDNWAYVKISGVEPTVANYLTGKYDNAYENTIQWHTSLPTTGDEYRTMNMVAVDATNPTFLKQAAVTGVAALCGLGHAPSIGTATTAPVTRMTRGGNSCAVASVCTALGTL